MRQYLVKIAAPAALFLLLHSTGFAQDEDHDSTAGKPGHSDEIIIKRKSDKDVKISVEIKDGQVFINGKPVAEFEDSDLSVSRRRIKFFDAGRTFSFSQSGDGDLLVSPDTKSIFRRGGVNSYGGDRRENSSRAYLGISSLKTENNEGAKVREITKGSAAEKAGLLKGDLIIRIDETKIEGPDQLSAAVRKYKPADKITVTYKRDGKELKTTATLGSFNDMGDFNYNYDYNYTIPPIPPVPPVNLEGLGFMRDSRPRLGIKAQDTEDGKGVKVLEVDDESTAEKAGVKEGDIITRFDGKEVNSAITLAEVARESRGKPSVKIVLIRDGKTQEIEVKTPRKLRTADL